MLFSRFFSLVYYRTSLRLQRFEGDTISDTIVSQASSENPSRNPKWNVLSVIIGKIV